MRRKTTGLSHDVTVIAESPETLDGLLEYLIAAGLVARGLRTVDAMAFVEATRAAVVLFPDGFALPEVIPLIRAIRTLRSDLLLVLVTGDAPSFQEAARPIGRSVSPRLLPKPAFGWAILDAIRLHNHPAGGKA